MSDWVVEGPRKINRDSVIAQNHYEHIDLNKLKAEVNRQIKFQGGKKIDEHFTRDQIDNAKTLGSKNS
jgi:NADH-quinone oxidoreductase subunit G